MNPGKKDVRFDLYLSLPLCLSFCSSKDNQFGLFSVFSCSVRDNRITFWVLWISLFFWCRYINLERKSLRAFLKEILFHSWSMLRKSIIRKNHRTSWNQHLFQNIYDLFVISVLNFVILLWFCLQWMKTNSFFRALWVSKVLYCSWISFTMCRNHIGIALWYVFDRWTDALKTREIGYIPIFMTRFGAA